MAARRRLRSQKEARTLFSYIPDHLLAETDGVIQCGLGDWAEGPVLLEKFPTRCCKYLAVEPVPRFCFEAWAAGFRGPIVQGALWNATGGEFAFQDFRSRTSMLDTEPRRGEIRARLYTLDDVVQFTQFSANMPLLWMDCEGVELTILQGAQNTLKNVHVLICELKDEPKMKNWPNTEVVVSEIEKLGFSYENRVADNGLFIRL